MNIEIHDRYSATGTPRPNPKTMCKGYCEGMGVYPERVGELNKAAVEANGGRLLIVGQLEKDGTPCEEDEHVWVKCPDCCGSRLQEPADELEFGGHKWKRI